MKKINSIIMAACVAALGFFSSCGGDDPADEMDAKVTIMPGEVGKVAIEATLIKDAQLWSVDGGNRTNISTTVQTKLDELVKNGNTIISGLAEGKYELIVANAKFTSNPTQTITREINIVGTGDGNILDELTYPNASINANGAYAIQRNGAFIGVLQVSEISATKVTVQFNQFNPVELSDAGASWLLIDGTSKSGVGASQMTAEQLAAIAPQLLCAKIDTKQQVGNVSLTAIKDIEGAVSVNFSAALTAEQLAAIAALQ